MKKRGLTWDEKINAYLRRREIRQARKHNAWLESVQPRLVAREWQGGAAYSFNQVPAVYILTSEDDNMPGGRLTLTSGVPVPTADVAGATAFYYTPYLSNQITIFDGSAVRQVTFGQVFVSNPATTNLPFDVFAFPSGGSISIETVNWVNDTTRAQALGYANGFLAKNSDNTRRYLGTLRTGAVAGQVDDSLLNRAVFNYYNRVARPVQVQEPTASWTYTTSSYRAANGNNANRVSVMQGIAESAISLSLRSFFTTDQAALQGGSISIGLDSVTVPDSNVIGKRGSATSTSPTAVLTAELHEIVPVGYHFYQWLESGTGTGITTWYGTAGSAPITQTGMTGMFFA